ncbi:MAG: ATP-binding protein [Actinobacteria bacterium]|nr:ATP-binding protein [Actinomycetota bacterium]
MAKKRFLIKGTSRNKTQQEAEKENLHSESEFAAILNSSPMLMILVDEERRVIKSNSAAASFSGRTIDEMAAGLRAGEALRCLNSMQDPQGCGFGTACKDCLTRITVNDTLETGKSHYRVECHLPFINNKKRDELVFHLYTSLLNLPEKLVIVWIQDITELKKSEGKIKKLNENLIKRARDLEKTNKKLENVQRAMINILDDFNVERIKTENANRELETALENVQQAKNAAEAANKELEAFSYSVSHDLRAPLRSMDGFSQILLEDYGNKLDEQARKYLQNIRSSSQLMAQLIDDILKLTRITRVEMKLEKINLSELASDVAHELKRMESGRKVNFVIAPDLVVMGDRLLLKSVFENLFGNAFKFTSKCSIARIEFGSIRKNGSQVYFVSDNGTGFDMAYVNKLFQPFQRLHSEKDYPGTGIGLASVQRIINRMGGEIWAEGILDKGATFYFKLKQD